MARIPTRTLKLLRAYLQEIQNEFPVQRAILFGSYARGEGRRDSDIDVAIFSDAFIGKRRVDVIARLLQKAARFPLQIEPIGFPFKDYLRPLEDEFIRTIRKEGKVII